MREPQTRFITYDSVWNAFDFTDSTGSIRCTITVDFKIFTIKAGYHPDSLVSSHTDTIPRFTLIDVKINQSIFYQIKIITMTGDTLSDTGAIETPSGIPPRKPENIVITPDYSGSIINWQASLSADEYVVYRKEEQSAIFEKIAITVNTNYYDSLDSFSKYIYTVKARNKFGESRSGTQVTGYKIIDLAPPSSLTASKGSLYRQIKLSWIANPSAKSVSVSRADNANGPYSEIASEIIGNSYLDEVSGNSFYYYIVSSLDQNKHSGKSSPYDSGFCRYFLDPPVIYDISGGTYENKIFIYWYPVAEALEYRIYRSENGINGKYLPIATTKDTFYVDYVNSTRNYYYEISTISPDSQEGQRATFKPGYVKNIDPPKNLIIEDDSKPCVPLKWDSVPDAAYYKIYRFSDYDSQAVFTDTTKINSYCDQVLPGRVWIYMVTLVNKNLVESRYSNAVISESQGIREPEKLVASQGISPAFVTLSWSPVPGAVGYHLYRSTSSSSSTLIHSRILDTTYIDSTAADTCFYRVCALDSSGGEGFFTGLVTGYPAPLEIVSNLRGSLNIHYALQISWDAAKIADKYLIYRSTTLSGPYIPVDTVIDPVYVDSSRISAYYKVAVMYCSRIGKLTESVYARKMEAPSNLQLSPEKNYLELSWNKTMGANSYSIYKSINNGGYTWIKNIQDNFYNDSAISSGLYSYRITSVSENGETPQSAAVSIKYKKGVENFTVTTANDSLKLKWSKVAGVSDYTIYVTNNSEFESDYQIYEDTFASLTYAQSDTYFLRIKPVLTGYTFPFSDTKSCFLLARPLAPIMDQVQSKIGYTVLKWNHNSSGEDADGYVIYRSNLSTSAYVALDTVTGLTYNDTLPSINTTYYYKVAGVNKSGIGQLSSYLYGSALPFPPPQNLTASYNLYGTHVALTWSGVSDAQKYIIGKANSSGSTPIIIDTCSDTFYNDSNAVVGSYFYYAVASLKGTEMSSWSAKRNGSRLPPPSTVYASGDYRYILVSWDIPSYSQKTYIYRSTNYDGPYLKIDSTAASQYTDSVTGKSIYYYRVSSANLNESVIGTQIASARLIKPEMPVSIRASQGLYEDTILIQWRAATGANEYEVYRSISSSFTNPVHVKTTSDTFTYDQVSADTFYYYKVKSINWAGESILSTSTASGYSIPVNVPQPPTDLQSTNSSEYIKLSWTMPDYNAIPYLGFVIYRAEENEGVISKFSVFDSTSNNEYNDYAERSYPTKYWYFVKTYNLRGQSASSNTVVDARQ